MKVEQQKILDQLYREWIQKTGLHRGVVERALQLEREVLIAEAKFKGVVEAFGGVNWRWSGEHVVFIPPGPEPNGQNKAKAGKIPGESRKAR